MNVRQRAVATYVGTASVGALGGYAADSPDPNVAGPASILGVTAPVAAAALGTVATSRKAAELGRGMSYPMAMFGMYPSTIAVGLAAFAGGAFVRDAG